MLYRALAETYQKLEATTLKLEKARILSDFLQNSPAEELDNVCYLALGRIYPGWSETELGIASLLMVKTLSKTYGVNPKKIEEEWKKTGDLGTVAENLTETKKQAALFKRHLSLNDVFENLRKLPSHEGSGSQEKKRMLISELFSSASPLEAKYLARTIIGNLRIGVAEGILRDAIAEAFFATAYSKAQLLLKTDGAREFERLFKIEGKRFVIEDTIAKYFEEDDESGEVKKRFEIFKEKNTVRIATCKEIDTIAKEETFWKKSKSIGADFIFAESDEITKAINEKIYSAVDEAIELSNDFGLVAKCASEEGDAGFKSITLELGHPIKVMLAQKSTGIDDALETVGTPCAIEYKYDGFRMQIHKKGDDVEIFTRRLENVTRQFPEIRDAVKKGIRADTCIIEGEAVGFDPKTKKYKAFQEISRRIKRKYEIGKTAEEIPIILNLFDILYLDGKSLIKAEFADRRRKLEVIVREMPMRLVLAEQLLTASKTSAEEFYKKSLEAGNEGIMFKNISAPYKPGSRVGHMIKLKPTMESLDLTIVGGEWGEGKRANWVSSFILACIDRDTGDFVGIGRMGTGIKEKTIEGLSFSELTEMLREHIIKEEGKTVMVEPSIVVEVAYEEIQKSPTYSSGYALRFPRLLRLRVDRAPQEIDDLTRVEDLYNKQRGRKQ
ncbi:MAG: ATP-dependent DNA ligase [Nanoarchaeota archaeon]|nr:ATP-dependent DNA ligase [Nanoarchaeota archaeon]MBU4300389.1 ATP-dependent DNA ligase [Nanoarchaeota archaeon]MBU4451341.1 ATP-dependent DNA ligase [Nanoarchaeota archaeon]MCG2723744.1 ATP-dependent DNA ligase [archaeon]